MASVADLELAFHRTVATSTCRGFGEAWRLWHLGQANTLVIDFDDNLFPSQRSLDEGWQVLAADIHCRRSR